MLCDGGTTPSTQHPPYTRGGGGGGGGGCWEMLSASLEEGMPPSFEDFAGLLHKCSKERNLVQALHLHDAYMGHSGLETHPSLGNHLVSVLVGVGSMCHAQQVFDKLLYRDECSWNSLITGYVKCGESRRALTLYQKMQENDALHPSRYAFVALLKACAALKDLEKGSKLHADIATKGLLERDLFIGSTLVNMYAKCGSLAKAQEVFDKLPVRDVVLWTAIMAGYADHGHGEEALNCVEQMQHEGISPDAFTFVCSLKACGSIRSLVIGQEIHAEIARKGLEREPLMGNTLVDMYAKCGSLATAQEVFDSLPVRDVVSWTALIAGYAEHGHGEEALDCFQQMQHDSIPLNAVTFVCILKACSSIGATVKGQEIHAEIARKGLERELLVGNTLVHMYAKCGLLVEAQDVFDKLPVRGVISCNALMAGFAEHGRAEEALNYFKRMREDNIPLNAVTFVCSLKACGSIGATVKGLEIHDEIARKGLERELLIGSTLADMYAKCGLLAEAQEVFDKIPVRDVVLWTALMTGYAEHGHGEEALHCFEQMQREGIYLNAVTFVCTLKACSSIGATVKGQEMHAEIVRKGFERDPLVGSTLVHTYAKCGSLAEAQDVFDKLPVQDDISWNALIAANAQLGESENVICMFDKMLGERRKPDLVTFVSVLNACSHAGLVDKGHIYFEAISNEYGFIPTLEHYTCMVDIFGRAGHIEKAVGMITKMPMHPGIVVWLTVLGACRKWGNVELGRYAFEHVVRLDEKDAAAYICMFNIYADAAMQEEAIKVEAMRVENQAWKKLRHSSWTEASPGCCAFLFD